MADQIFIGVAWPYANGPLHLGQIAGANLPADIFARYHRLKGDTVLMVSGTDQHGTPVTIRAEQEKVTPQLLVDRYHTQYLEAWKRLGISYDLYTHTGTRNHQEVVQDVFLTLHEKGLLYTAWTSHPYCEGDDRFLPDRYVEGTCPFCNNGLARGDQCELCGKPLTPQDLINWRCRLCGSAPVMRESNHFYLRLGKFQDILATWIKPAEGRWRTNVYNFTRGWLSEGLLDRPVTRDIDWGVPIPIQGYEGKRIYVWFEAVIGYLSASIEWAQLSGQPEAWKAFWQNPSCKSYYFLGKDNIPFHTIIWPSMLMGYGDYDPEKDQGSYNLPYDVPANQFLSLEGKKFSTSQNWAIWLNDFLDRYQPDPLRYYLAANMPEYSDSDFSWKAFVQRNNDELVATFGNLVHRVLTLIHQNFDGRIPHHGKLDPEDNNLLLESTTMLEEVDRSLSKCRFREAINRVMSSAGAANRYLNFKAPWRTAKEDLDTCGTTLWVALVAISALKTALTPFLPFTAERLHTMLGFQGHSTEQGWGIQFPNPGSLLEQPIPLIQKLDEELIKEETERLDTQSKLS